MKIKSYQRLLEICIILIFYFVVFLGEGFSSNAHQSSLHKVSAYSKKECLKLTTEDFTYKDAVDRLTKIKEVVEMTSLLGRKNAAMAFLNNETKFMTNKCYWLIRVHEDQGSHLVFWKTFLVQIGGSKIYEEDYANDSYQPINQ